MDVYRLTKVKYKDPLDPFGAHAHGGRFNSKGVSVLYTGDSAALALLETRVHSPAPFPAARLLSLLSPRHRPTPLG